MEFKDRLKKLRKEKGLSQATLASAVFVSRSAVAKWENGLGLPGKDSYEALLAYFGVDESAFPLNEEVAAMTIPKNRTIYLLRSLLLSVLTALLIVLPPVMLYAFGNGYGFTSRMAAGERWHDKGRIDTRQYDFYYDTWIFDASLSEGFSGEFDLQVIDHFCVVKRSPIGYQRLHDLSPYEQRIYDESGNELGSFYVFFDGSCYHYLFKSLLIAKPGEGISMSILSEIRVKEERIPLFHCCYFKSELPVTVFEANGVQYTVESSS